MQLLSHIHWCDHLCGLVVRVPGFRTEMYRVSCEVRTEFMYVEVFCASDLEKYIVRLLCTTGRSCGDWGIMSIIYRI
jgi:hypothetical protein